MPHCIDTTLLLKLVKIHMSLTEGAFTSDCTECRAFCIIAVEVRSLRGLGVEKGPIMAGSWARTLVDEHGMEEAMA